jgi:DNA repair exonuclease SbcCD ATPase subunit
LEVKEATGNRHLHLSPYNTPTNTFCNTASTGGMRMNRPRTAPLNRSGSENAADVYLWKSWENDPRGPPSKRGGAQETKKFQMLSNHLDSLLGKRPQSAKRPQSSASQGSGIEQKPPKFKYNAADGSKTSWLIQAAGAGRLDIIQENIKLACRAVDNFGFSTLHAAAQSGSIAIASVLLNANPNLISQATNNGSTAYQLALKHGHAGLAKKLAEADQAALQFAVIKQERAQGEARASSRQARQEREGREMAEKDMIQAQQRVAYFESKMKAVMEETELIQATERQETDIERQKAQDAIAAIKKETQVQTAEARQWAEDAWKWAEEEVEAARKKTELEVSQSQHLLPQLQQELAEAKTTIQEQQRTTAALQDQNADADARLRDADTKLCDADAKFCDAAADASQALAKATQAADDRIRRVEQDAEREAQELRAECGRLAASVRELQAQKELFEKEKAEFLAGLVGKVGLQPEPQAEPGAPAGIEPAKQELNATLNSTADYGDESWED